MEQALLHFEGTSPHATPAKMLQHIWSSPLAVQGSGLFYFSDMKTSTAKGVIPIELAKVEAARDKTEKKRFLIKVWVATAYTDAAKHRRYILSAQSSQVQVTPVGCHVPCLHPLQPMHHVDCELPKVCMHACPQETLASDCCSCQTTSLCEFCQLHCSSRCCLLQQLESRHWLSLPRCDTA